MADSFTSNYNLVLQQTGSNSGTWGGELNNELITPVDLALGGLQAITMTNANVTLTLTQWQNKIFKVSGALTAQVLLVLPLSPNAVGGTPAVGGEFIVWNNTSGNFALGVITAVAGSTGVWVPQGGRSILFSDGTNVWHADDGTSIPVGASYDFFGGTVPPGSILGYGQLVTVAQYPALFAAYGYFYGGSGASFGVPDLRGRVVAGIDNMGGTAANRIGTVITDNGTIVGTTLGSAGGSSTHTQAAGEVGQHTHGVNDPEHTHTPAGSATIPSGALGQYASGGFSGQASGSGGALNPATTGIGIQNNAAPTAMAWLPPTIMGYKLIYAGS